jgi:hypothetical protein
MKQLADLENGKSGIENLKLRAAMSNDKWRVMGTKSWVPRPKSLRAVASGE